MMCSTVRAALTTLLLSTCHAIPSQKRRGQEAPRSAKTHKYPVYKADKLDKADMLDTPSTSVSLNKSLRINEEDVYELSTTYEGGWVQDGIMFDVRITNSTEGISILGLDILTPAAFQTLCVEIYSRMGSYEGYDNMASSWDFLGSVEVIGLGKDTPTIIPLGSFDPVYVGPDETRAFYVTTQNENLRYTAYPSGEHLSGSVFSSSSDAGVNVDVLVGVAKNYPFAQSWPNRMFNGAIRYAIGDNLDLESILSEDQASSAEIVSRGKLTCDAEPVITASPTDPPVMSFSPVSSAPVLSAPVSSAPVVVDSPTMAPIVPTTTDAPSPPPTNGKTLSPTMTPVASIATDPPSPQPIDVETLSPTTLAFTMKKLATTLHGGLKQAGVMFDVRVPSVEEGGPAEGITILTFEVSTFLTEDICVEVYSKDGTHVGYETDVVQGDDGSWSSPTWSAVGAATATGVGEALPTHLPVGAFDYIHMKPGETRAYYVTMNTPEMRYTEPRYNEKTGDVFVESSMSHLQFMVGTAMSYPFADSWSDRIYNGAVIFALGEVKEGTYDEMAASDRSRSCAVSTPSTTDSPTNRPTTSPIEKSTQNPTVAAVKTDSPVVPQSVMPTTAPSGTTTDSETDSPDNDGEPRLDDSCPSASPEDASSKEVVVEYKYTIVTSSDDSVRELEDSMHSELVKSKCGATSNNNKFRQLQSSIDYYGFNSNPPDKVIPGVDCTGVSLSEGEECLVVQGGFTAYVPENVDESDVTNDLSPFADDVLTENGAVVESDADSSRAPDSATVEDQTQDISEDTQPLSTVAIIVLAAVAGCVALALIIIFMK